MFYKLLDLCYLQTIQKHLYELMHNIKTSFFHYLYSGLI